MRGGEDPGAGGGNSAKRQALHTHQFAVLAPSPNEDENCSAGRVTRLASASVRKGRQRTEQSYCGGDIKRRIDERQFLHLPDLNPGIRETPTRDSDEIDRRIETRRISAKRTRNDQRSASTAADINESSPCYQSLLAKGCCRCSAAQAASNARSDETRPALLGAVDDLVVRLEENQQVGRSPSTRTLSARS